jgi:DNA (cytosine-5)-methyltransferase 1
MSLKAPGPTGASLARGRSKQNYGTPTELLRAVQKRFGRIYWDLAAHEQNAVVGSYLGPGSLVAEDALAFDWSTIDGLLWLNPPFADIAPWARECAAVRDRLAWTLLLVPASVGSAWWHEHVHGKGLALLLAPRLTFRGCDQPYPKDCALVAYGFGVAGYEPWRWDR